ncbi:MAG: tRNA epoxyqueuosine(34) reductase QueG [Bacteroidota bacterium]
MKNPGWISPNGERSDLNLKEKIFNKARELGFDKTGVAKASPFGREIENYEDWLRRGYNASLGYMERNLHKRADVREILPSAKSVIVLAMNYYTPFKYKPAGGKETYGRISRYAWGTDYHYIIEPKLKEIEEFIREIEPKAESRSYVDTGPLMERQWAVRAGIGWQGKNGNVISPEFGSWFFIGVIISSLELQPDVQIGEMCAQCTKCINACPTGAITEPQVVEANKCIDYWTVEAKPDIEIPDEVGSKLNNRVFGCDICQEVCPWNKKAQKNCMKDFFMPRGLETELELDDIDNMMQEEFSRRFSKSPVKRTKIAGLKRNARTIRRLQ